MQLTKRLRTPLAYTGLCLASGLLLVTARQFAASPAFDFLLLPPSIHTTISAPASEADWLLDYAVYTVCVACLLTLYRLLKHTSSYNQKLSRFAFMAWLGTGSVCGILATTADNWWAGMQAIALFGTVAVILVYAIVGAIRLIARPSRL